MIDKLIILFFCLIPFGSFFFTKLDVWHGSGQFVQVGILILFCYSFFEKPKYSQVNKPLGAFLLWAGLSVSYWWVKVLLLTNNYPVKILLPFFNLLCLVLLYKLIVENLNKEGIDRIIKYFRYSLVLFLVYCGLQYFNLDEFLKSITGKDEIVGTIGNQGHLAGYLAIVQPILFKKKLTHILPLILLWIFIILSNSASGIAVGIAVILFSLFFYKKFSWFYSLVGCLFVAIPIVAIKYPLFFADNQRFRIWGEAYNLIKDKAVTGYSLGYFSALKIPAVGGGNFRHVHNEYLQVTLELGLVGLVLALWLIWDYFNRFKRDINDTSIKLASIFFGFCVLSLFSFPGHLWVVSTFALFSYAGMYVKNEV